MSRNSLARCYDIIEAIGKIRTYEPKMNGPDSEMALDAIVRQLAIIGEAASRLDPPDRTLAQHIQWRKIIGLRNIAVHEYFRVDPVIIQGVVTDYLPDLLNATEKIVLHNRT